MRMHCITLGAALLLVPALALVLPAVSAAQDVDVAASADVDDLKAPEPAMAFNLGRVRHRLALSLAREESGSLLHLEYQLSVYGVAPPIEFLQGFDVNHGAVPFGGPTHTDFQDFWTPREFRAPAVPLMPLIRWTFGR